MGRKMQVEQLDSFKQNLIVEERSEATIEKYLRDVGYFFNYIRDTTIEKSHVIAYKSDLTKKYTVKSANSMIASLNAFFRFCGWLELCIKQFRVQAEAYCSEEKELTKAEYFRLIEVSKRKGNERLSLIIQTICGTGIRVSELQYITVEAVTRGEAFVRCKGKNRRIFIVEELRQKLLRYVRGRGITQGAVFVTKNGKAVSRCNIWRDMKALCASANVAESKVFPHNLRHLFARTFYGLEKDIAKLADILGHTNINTTRIYIVTTGAEHRRRMENMRLIV